LLLEARTVKKNQEIIISGVRQASKLWESGVRPGDKLVAISDPNLEDVVWELDSTSSLRFVRDALRMRIPDTITLEVEKGPVSRSRFS
jgi:predicted metalloprotease with PDZ domain